jgi:hypothetical protein
LNSHSHAVNARRENHFLAIDRTNISGILYLK